MDKAYDILRARSNLIGNIILGCAAFSSIITLERPDYNLFLFVFIAYTMFWKEEGLKTNQKIINLERMLLTFVLIISLLVDVIWTLSHSNLNSSFIIYLSWIELVIKIFVIIIVFVMWKGNKKESSQSELEGTGFKQFEEEA